MSEELDRQVRRILRLRPGTVDILHNREGNRVEFKESFSLGSLARYTRTMVAFANNAGGYIIFGVEPSPHRLKGVNPRFKTVDPASISSFLRDHVSPDPDWEIGEFEYHGVDLGYLYVYEAREKPIIATASAGKDVKEGEIYYRYRGQSTRVRFAELKSIIDARLERERKAWLEHLRSISQAGPLNVGVLNTVEGQIHGTGPPFLIEESLLEKIRFIREGRFRETSGEPTLRLIGDLEPVGGVLAREGVGVGIHAENLYEAFLSQKPLSPIEARSYVRETAYQTSPFTPLFYFIQLARVSRRETIELLESATTSFDHTRARIIKRLRGQESLGSMGAIGSVEATPGVSTEQELIARFEALRTQKDRRTLLVRVLGDRPSLVQQACSKLPAVRVAEATSHLTKEEVESGKQAILAMLLQMFRDEFRRMDGNAKTAFRKAVTVVDALLFGA
ncbi:MAG: ATP-binding protein [Thermoanaerobaculia bacterium]